MSGRFLSRFQTLPLRYKVALCVLSGVCVHAAAVEVANGQRKVEPAFVTGSADDKLADSLSSGDIVMYSRRFYMYHLPTALLVKLQQFIYDTDFDHVGVVVVRDGTPYVLERTPWSGYQCQRFDINVRRSGAAHILVLPVEKQLPLTDRQKYRIRRFVDQVLAEGTKAEEIEATRMLSCAKNYIMEKYFGQTGESPSICANAELVQRAWSTLGYRVVNSDHSTKVTLKDFHNRQVLFEPTEGGGGCGRVDVAKEDFMIRSS